MNSKYKQECQDAIEDFIASMLVNNPGQAQPKDKAGLSVPQEMGSVESQRALRSKYMENLEDLDFEEYSFEVDLTCNLQGQVYSQQVNGKKYPKNAFVAERKADVDAFIAETSQLEVKNSENLQAAKNLFDNSPFASYLAPQSIKSLKNIGAFIEKCSSCGGSGKTSCTSCGGSGKVTCPNCGGSGRIARTYYDHSSQQNRTEYQACHCWSGRINCGSCGGSGQQNCSHCGGTGYHTTVYDLEIEAQPNYQRFVTKAETKQYILDVLPKIELNRYAGASHIALNKFENLESQLNYNYTINTEFSQFEGIIKGKKVKWVVFGTPPKIGDSGQVFDIILEEKIDDIDSKSSVAYSILGKRRQKASLQDFFSSHINTKLLELFNQNKSPEACSLALNSALSEKYINKCHNVLNKIISSRSIISFIYAWLFASFGCILANLSHYLDLIKSRGLGLELLKAVDGKHYLNFLPETHYLTILGEIWFVASLWCIGSFFIFRFFKRFWFSRAGGKTLKNYAKSRETTYRSMFCLIALSFALVTLFFMAFPFWVDLNWQLYGIFPIASI